MIEAFACLRWQEIDIVNIKGDLLGTLVTSMQVSKSQFVAVNYVWLPVGY